VSDSIAQRLDADAIDFIANNWIEGLRRALHLDANIGAWFGAWATQQFLAKIADRLAQIDCGECAGPQFMYRVSALGDRLRRLLDGALKPFLGLLRPPRQEVQCGLEP
jgi:hypothetical protein